MRENVIAVVVIIGIITGLYFLIPVIYPLIAQPDPDEVITVSIELENRCSFDDDVFVVKTVKSERSFRFTNGKAIISVPRKAQLVLAVSRDYPGFEYSDIPHKISEDMPMKMIADCTTSPRLQSTMDALKQQFQN